MGRQYHNKLYLVTGRRHMSLNSLNIDGFEDGSKQHQHATGKLLTAHKNTFAPICGVLETFQIRHECSPLSQLS